MKKNSLWLGVVGIIVIIFGTIYGTVQQAQRNDADMPQIQMAEDTAASLNNQIPPNMAVTGHIDMAASLAPFTIIYSKSGQPLIGSGYLDNQLPQIPFGVLQAANNKPYHRVTWQPTGTVRIAAVAVQAKNFYVLSGRNMKQVENNIQRTFQIAAFGCALSLALLAGTFVLSRKASQTKWPARDKN